MINAAAREAAAGLHKACLEQIRIDWNGTEDIKRDIPGFARRIPRRLSQEIVPARREAVDQPSFFQAYTSMHRI